MAIEYLNNKVFEGLIERFRLARDNATKDKKEYELAQVALADAFYLLAQNIIRAFKFQLVDKDDSLQEGVLICFEKLHRFDPLKGRAFNFCTTIMLNHFRQLYRTARNYNDLKLRYHQFICDKNNDIHLILYQSKKGRSPYQKIREHQEYLYNLENILPQAE